MENRLRLTFLAKKIIPKLTKLATFFDAKSPNWYHMAPFTPKCSKCSQKSPLSGHFFSVIVESVQRRPDAVDSHPPRPINRTRHRVPSFISTNE